MINIEIKGVQFSNKGAELMLLAIIAQLDEHLGEYNLVLSPGPNLPYVARAKLGALQKLSFRRGPIDLTGVFGKLPQSFKRLLMRYGIITEADVDIILNASGFSYGDQWPLKDLKNAAKEARRFKQAKKPYILLPQALGPFSKSAHAEAARELLRSACLVFARDKASFEACKALGDSNGLKQSPDFTALVEPKMVEPFKTKTVCLIPNNKVVSAFHHSKAENSKSEYVSFWRRQIDFFSNHGFDVILLNHEGKEDRVLCSEIARNMQKVEILDGLGAIEIKSLLGRCHAVVSSRFHGCVSALSQGVPCLATSWSHKYEMLFEEYGISGNIIDYLADNKTVEGQLLTFLDSLEQQRESNLTSAGLVKKENKKMWQQVFEAIHLSPQK